MNRRFLHILLAALLLFCVPLPAVAREVVLEAGETYQENDLIIRCAERRESRLMVLSDCQFWDDFANKCLHERKTHHMGRLQCVEECQHWDSFNNVCHFATQCRFFPEQRAFVRITCDLFDEFANTCLKTRQELIR